MAFSIFFVLFFAVVFVLILASACPSLFPKSFIKFLKYHSQGKSGERLVAFRYLEKLPENYHIINDVTIPCKWGTSQIDHLVISEFGIFVIETKTYTGRIFGTEDKDEWTSSYYGNRYTFRNPIKQNNGHIMALHQLLGLDRGYFRNIVTFYDGASLKIHTRNLVVQNQNLLPAIMSFQTRILTREQVIHIIQKIEENKMVGEDVDEIHESNVKSYILKQEQKIADGICPRCGGNLVVRRGKYGKFYGCINYPKCKYARDS